MPANPFAALFGGASGAPQDMAAALQQIADSTGGTYFAASDAAGLRSIYQNLDTQLVSTPALTELTSLFAGAGALLLLAGGMASLFATGRLP